LLVTGCGSLRTPFAPPWVDPGHLHFEVAVAEVGQPAPDFRLETPDGSRKIALSDLRERPVVLIFGSYT